MRHITVPTAAEVNALPEPMRDYIHQLETHDVDPQGDIRALWEAREQVRQLTAKVSTTGDGCPECGWNDMHSPQCRHAGTPAPPAVADLATPMQTLRVSLQAEESQAESDQAVAGLRSAVVERAALEQLIVKWHGDVDAEVSRLKQFCYGGEKDGEMLDENIAIGFAQADQKKACADELEALLRAVPSERENGTS